MSSPPEISVVIVNFNGGDDLLRCVTSVKAQGGAAEIVVVDNGSTDGSDHGLALEHADVRLVRSPVNDGFAGGVRRGVQHSSAPDLLFLNPDIQLKHGCIDALRAALHSQEGVYGPLLLVGDDGTPENGCRLDLLGDPVPLQQPARPLWVAGAALATTRRLYERLGGFDERYFLIAEDEDFCWRVLLAGGEVALAPGATAEHRGGGGLAGGYTRKGVIEITTFRIAMRERNMLATELKCAPASRLAWLVPLRLVRLAGIGAGAALMRHPELARALCQGVVWNVLQLPETLRRRRAVGVDGRMRRAVFRSRVHPAIRLIDEMRSRRLPRFVD